MRGVGILAIVLGVLFATCTGGTTIPVGTPETVIGIALITAGVVVVIYSLRRDGSNGK